VNELVSFLFIGAFICSKGTSLEIAVSFCDADDGPKSRGRRRRHDEAACKIEKRMEVENRGRRCKVKIPKPLEERGQEEGGSL